jgi:hypothetical protein
MKAKFILSACIILFIGVMTLDAQMIERTDAMWVRTVPEGTITLDGVLDEPEWDQAETWVIRYGEDAGMPYSGWRSEGGVPTTDSTHAILRFLVEGDYLYLGATVYDKSIGGSADWAHWDVLLMNIPDRLSPERPTPPGEYMYGWWYPQADTALPAGLGPRFIGRWAQWEYTEPRTEEQIEAWDAVTTVQGLSNDDSVEDTSYTVEMRFKLDVMGYDLQNPDGEIVEFNISIWDADYNWPNDPEKFSSNRVWWQNPWGNNNGNNKARLYVDPAVTVETAVLPEIEAEAFIPNASNHTPPTINGSLTDMVWEYAPSFDIRFGDDALRDTYPSIGPYRSGQWQPEIDGARADILDPADATVHWFFIEDTLYLGFDVRDQVVVGTDEFDLRDGVRVTLNDRTQLTEEHFLQPRELFVWVGPDGEIRYDGFMEVLVDTLGAARVGLSLKDNTIVDDPTNVDEGYTIEMAIDLTALGYPSGRGDGVVFLGFTVFDGDIMENPADTYGNRVWWFREHGGVAAAAWTYMDPNMYLAHPDDDKVPVTFYVDMTDASPFDPETDDVYIAGNIWDPEWQQPGSNTDLMLEPVEVYPDIYRITLSLLPDTYSFKFFRVINGAASWDNGEWPGDPNRSVEIIGSAHLYYKWGVQDDVVMPVVMGRDIVPTGTVVTMEGIVTRAMGDFTRIQDATAGFTIRSAGDRDWQNDVASGELRDGDRVRVTGQVSQFNQLRQFNQAELQSYERLARDQQLPAPIDVTLADIAEHGRMYQSMLLHVADIEIDTEDTVYAAARTYSIRDASAEFGTVDLRMGNAQDTFYDGEPVISPFSFTGVLGQFHSSDPNAGFQLMPIREGDLDIGVSVGDRDKGLPTVYHLDQNYPNPFNPSTTIRFALPQQSQVTLEIYNVLGQRVRTLIADDLYEAGYYDVVWDGRNQAGGVVSSGLYIYRITAGEFTNVKKMLFLK